MKKTYNDFEPYSKDQAYWERNQLVSALSKIYPSWMELHPLEDKEWDKEWRHIVFIEIPVRHRNPIGHSPDNKKIMQLSWHIHDDEVTYFDHLDIKKGNSWDGHDTDEKYRRLEALFI